MTEFPTYEEMAKNIAEKALDNFMYNGKSIREWMQIITSEDCISRQSVLDMMQMRMSGKELYKAVYELPSVTPTQKWIPVSERLPNRDEYIKNNGLFIVSDGNRSYSEWFDIYDKQRFGELTMSGFRVDYTVTAWMPLPEPYKAESEE